MSVAAVAWIWISSLALLACMLAIHRRFTLKAATLTPLPLLCGGALGALLSLILDQPELPSYAALRVVLIPLLIGLIGASTVWVRHLVAGIPARLATPPGPTINDVLAAMEIQGKAQQATAAEMRLELLGAVGVVNQALDRFAIELAQQNHATFTAALHGVIDDFHQRINGQFHQQLATLEAFVASIGALLDKHRGLQVEMMHHTRREADQVTRSVEAFQALLDHSTDLAALATQVRQAYALLAPRQEALSADVAQLAQELANTGQQVAALNGQLDGSLEEFTQRSKRHVDAVGQRVGQSANELQLAVQRAAEQTRNQLSDIAGKYQQQLAAMNKEVSETLVKPLAAMNKQLTGMQSKLNTDLAPVAQQIRRVADMSKR